MKPTCCASQLLTRTHTCCMGTVDITGDCTTLVTGIDATDALIIGDPTGRIIGEAAYEMPVDMGAPRFMELIPPEIEVMPPACAVREREGERGRESVCVCPSLSLSLPLSFSLCVCGVHACMRACVHVCVCVCARARSVRVCVCVLLPGHVRARQAQFCNKQRDADMDTTAAIALTRKRVPLTGHK